MIKDGSYRAQVIGATFGYTRNQKQQIEILLRIEGTDEDVSCLSSFSGDAAQYTLEKMRTCGWSDSDGTNLGNMRNTVDVVLATKTNEYGTRQEVMIYPPRKPGTLRTPEHARMHEDEAAFMLSSLGVPVAAPAQRPAPRQAPPPRRTQDGPPPMPGDDAVKEYVDPDDIPF